MECAYIDNLKAQTLKKKDNELFNLITENAMKNVGAHNVIVQRNIKKPHVRRVIKKWIQIAKSNILHNVKRKAEAADDIVFEDEFQQQLWDIVEQFLINSILSGLKNFNQGLLK